MKGEVIFMNSFNAVATMTSKGQLTVPKAVREAMGLFPGSEVRFEVDPAAGKSVMAPIQHNLEDLWAFADHGSRPSRTLSFSEMNRAKATGASR